MGDLRRRSAVALGITGPVVPLTVALGAAPAQAASCTTQTGPYQKQVEKFLGRPVDGKQSTADYKAIKAFQTKHKGRIACVNLTLQLSWIQDGKTLVYGPVPVRTGRNGYETRTGLKKIYWRHIDHVSSIYDVPMPYSQFFDGGQAFHSVGVSMWNPPGSHGCVNMTKTVAKKYWSLLKKGDDVFVYGRKPGT